MTQVKQVTETVERHSQDVGKKHFVAVIRHDGSRFITFYQAINQKTGQPWQAYRNWTLHESAEAALSVWRKAVEEAQKQETKN
jgi:hypothetical protein